MSSKSEQMKGRLAAIAKDRETFEKQKQELEDQMNKGKQNMGRIRKGLRNNEICETSISIDAQSEENVSRKFTGKIKATSGGGGIEQTVQWVNGSPPSSATINQAIIVPSGPRVSEWCFTGVIESTPPVVKSQEIYENIRLLGRGSFGDVNLVKNVEDNRLYADKTIFNEKETDLKAILREVKFLRISRHPYIIDIHDAFVIAYPRVLHIVMPYCEAGDLGKVVSAAKKNRQSIPEAKIIQWTTQIALALHHLHEHNTLHRDLKPCNIMLTEGGEIAKVADLGLAVQLVDGVCASAAEAGTPLYTPPEMITGERYSFPTDCWSFGVMLHELLRLEPPFTGTSTKELVANILTEPPPGVPSHYSEEIKLINCAFLIKNPIERLGFAGMLMSELFLPKLHAFPATYRPKAVEERTRRAHTKQLCCQIEALQLSRHSSKVLPVAPVIHQPYTVQDSNTAQLSLQKVLSTVNLTTTVPDNIDKIVCDSTTQNFVTDMSVNNPSPKAVGISRVSSFRGASMIIPEFSGLRKSPSIRSPMFLTSGTTSAVESSVESSNSTTIRASRSDIGFVCETSFDEPCLAVRSDVSLAYSTASPISRLNLSHNSPRAESSSSSRLRKNLTDAQTTDAGVALDFASNGLIDMQPTTLCIETQQEITDST